MDDASQNGQLSPAPVGQLVDAIAARDDDTLRQLVRDNRSTPAGHPSAILADIAQVALERLVTTSQLAALTADPAALALLTRLATDGPLDEALVEAPPADLLLTHRFALRRRARTTTIWEITPRGREALALLP